MLCRPAAFAAELGRSAVTETLAVHQKEVSFQMDMLLGPLADALTFAVQVSEGLCRQIIGVADPDIQIAGIALRNRPHAPHDEQRIYSWPAGGEVAVIAEAPRQGFGDMQFIFARCVVVNTTGGLMGEIAGQHRMIDVEQQRQQRQKLLLPLRQRLCSALAALLVQLDKALPDEAELLAVNAVCKVMDVDDGGVHG